MGIIGATIMQNKTMLDPNLKNVNRNDKWNDETIYQISGLDQQGNVKNLSWKSGFS